MGLKNCHTFMKNFAVQLLMKILLIQNANKT